MSESVVNGTDRPQVGRGKIRGAVKQLMDLMADGLSVPASDRDKPHDLIVVGGGSAGLAAAMEAALTGVNTLVIDRADYEEARGAVDFVRCCPELEGWLASRKPGKPAAPLSECYNLDMLLGKIVTSIGHEGRCKVVVTEEGKEYRAKAILLSPGARYRRLGVPGEEEFMAAGIHHCSACEGLAYAGKEIVVVGSGDFGIKEAIALAEYASLVTVLEPSDRLMCSGPLAEAANRLSNLEVRLNSRVLEFDGDGNQGNCRLRSVKVEEYHSGDTEILPVDAVFIFMVTEPNTDFLWGAVELDPWGFIKTAPNADLTFQTSHDGIFVAGDARSNSIRCAPEAQPAQEEGVAAASEIRRFLENTEVAR